MSTSNQSQIGEGALVQILKRISKQIVKLIKVTYSSGGAAQSSTYIGGLGEYTSDTSAGTAGVAIGGAYVNAVTGTIQRRLT